MAFSYDYTSIYDNSTVDLALVKQHLAINLTDTSKDNVLNLALAAAKRAADDYCQDTFTTVPEPIEMWILAVVGLWWERKNPFIVTTHIQDLGTTDWEFNYDDYFHMIKNYRRHPGFGGY